MALPKLVNVYVPVSLAMKKPLKRSADWLDSKLVVLSARVRRVEPVGHEGVEKVRDCNTPRNSGFLFLKNGEVNPLLARFALKELVYLR